MTHFTVAAGQTLSGITLGSGDYCTVAAGGIATGLVVNFGSLVVQAGGTASDTVLQSGFVTVSGTTTGTQVRGGFDTVEAGGVSTGTVVSGGFEQIMSGGTARQLSGTSSSLVNISAGGLVSGVAGKLMTVVAKGGSIDHVTLSGIGSLADGNIPYASNQVISLDGATDVLTVTENGSSYMLQLSGDYTGQEITTSLASGAAPVGSSSFDVQTPYSPIPLVAAGASSATINASNSVASLASGNAYVVSGTNDLVGLTGAGNVQTSPGTSSTILLGSGPATVLDNGQDAVFGGSGAATITGGSASEIVVGSGGPLTITASAGGGAYWGGGNSTIHGRGGTTVMIGSDNDKLYAGATGTTLFGVLNGSVLMDGTASHADDVFFGGGGTGHLTFLAGYGNDIMGLGRGSNDVTLGYGHDTVFANANATGPSTISSSLGSADIVLAGQSVTLQVLAGHGGQAFNLYNYTAGADHVHLVGYGADEVAQALSQQSNVGGSAVLRLSDADRITLIGVARADAGLFS